VLLQMAVKFQGVPAPGEEIVPSKEPVVKPVNWLNTRSTLGGVITFSHISGRRSSQPEIG
jgi:hypothetical protein